MRSHKTRMSRHKQNERKNIIIAILFLMIVFMTAGYAAYTRELVIRSTGKIPGVWDIKFTGITTESIIGDASNESPPAITDDTTAAFSANLVMPGDKITYAITVFNEGNIPAKLDAILGIPTDTSNDAIIFNISNIAIEDTLAPLESKTFLVTAEIPNNIKNVTEAQKEKTINITLVYNPK